MSYNILKKNVRFSGDSAGTIEGMVDTSSDQVISGSKDFESLTGSNALITGDLSVSNNISVQSITASAHVSSSFFYGDGSNLTGLTGVAGSAAGSTSEIQFNDAGSFSSDSGFTFATGSSTLSVNTGSVEVLSASNYVSASTYYGDGSNLANITANSVNASKIIGQISGSQISASTGLTTDGNNLAVNLRANGGITDDSGLGLDAGDLSAYSSTYDDSYNIIISGSGAVKNRKVALSWLEGGIELNADRITAGTLNANRLPSEITASFSGTLAQYTELTASTALISGDLITHNIYPEADEQYDIGQDGLGYENLYAKFLNGGITFSAVNDEGATINKGDVVYIKGISGQTPTVGLAACDDPAKMPAFGLVGDGSITNGSTGRIVTFGRLNGFDTSTFSEGDTLFVQTGSGGTSGSLTNVAPTGSGNLLQNIGKVTYSDASGQVRVGGAGRTNATPNLDEGYIFIGNSTDQSVQDNTIYVSSSVSRVGINNTNPQHTLSVDGEISASFFIGDGSQLINLPDTSPAGANTQIQLNADGVFGASSKFTFSTSSATLDISKSTTTGNEAKIWFHSGSAVFGAGSGSYIESDSDNNLNIDLNNASDAGIRFITRPDIPANQYVKMLVDGTNTQKGVAIGNVDGFGLQDLYVSNVNSIKDTNILFHNRATPSHNVNLKLSSSTAETSFTNTRLTGDFTLSHQGGDINIHSTTNLNLTASSNISIEAASDIGITGSSGLVAEFDSGNSYLFKARKLYYKEITFQLASSLSGGDVVWLPMGGTLNDISSQQYYTKFIAPFDGEIVKVMMRADLAAGAGSYTLKSYKASNATEHPTTLMETKSILLNSTANTTRTANFTTSTFSAGDVLGFDLTLPTPWSPASSIGVNATIVIAYDELS